MHNGNISARSGNRLGELSVASPELADFRFTMEAKTLVGSGRLIFANLAMVFGYVSDTHYNYMLFHGMTGSTQLFAVVEGVRSPALATATSAGILNTAWQPYKVVRQGDRVDVFRGDMLLLSATDARLGTVGKVGVGSLSEAAAFDDIVVTENNEVTEPDPTQWAGFPREPSGWVDTVDWLGMLYHSTGADWVFIASANRWMLIPAAGMTPHGAWIYRGK